MSGFLSLGDNYRVPLELFQDNRAKLRRSLSQTETEFVVLSGGPSPTRFDTDHEPVFRQESYFWWLTGVKEPDCSLILTSTETILLIPELPASYATFMGKIKTCEEWKEHYQVDRVLYTHQLEATLETLISAVSAGRNGSSSPSVLLLEGTNADSGTTYGMAPKFQSKILQEILDKERLFPVLAECRVFKSPMELALMEHVTQLTSLAHAYVMRNTRAAMWEFQCESLFRHFTYYNYGSRLQSYTSICGCGPNSAILHYGHAGEPNSRQLQEDDHCLFDMGAEYQCYASDVTCSFPVNGKFTKKYAQIYQAVLDAQIAVYEMARPGTSWVDCHKRAESVILQALVNIGLVVLPVDSAMTVKDLVELRLGAVFMPHGLGHLIGIDTHDVGGYLPSCPERSSKPGLSKLRTARVLQPNMVLTVEPGLYFIDHLLDEALEDPKLCKFLNSDLLKEYRGYGGVRLEDVVCISDDQCINYTLCPRTIMEVEHVMEGGKWPPMTDEAPELRRIHLTEPISLFGPPPSH